ncbi:Peptidylprolyl isomerase [Psidium guajava]|nr:Peptidylprolyl isomerase [Psidium guajava]
MHGYVVFAVGRDVESVPQSDGGTRYVHGLSCVFWRRGSGVLGPNKQIENHWN